MATKRFVRIWRVIMVIGQWSCGMWEQEVFLVGERNNRQEAFKLMAADKKKGKGKKRPNLNYRIYDPQGRIVNL